MAVLAAICFAAFLLCAAFVVFPSLVARMFERAGGFDSDHDRGVFLMTARRLSAIPMGLALALAIYCGWIAREHARRQPLLDQQAQERADKVRRYSSASVYKQPEANEKRSRSGARP